MSDQENALSNMEPGRLNAVMFAARRAQDYRCRGCGRLLGRVIFAPGMYLSLKCHRCGRITSDDVPVNTTSAPVLVSMLDALNGHTPETVVLAAVRLVERTTEADE